MLNLGVFWTALLLLAAPGFFPGVARAEGATASWEPVIQLRDRTDHFPGKPDRPTPTEGWWVTPIHSSLLADGKVLINGWGRYDRQNCRIHRTRQNGESFILDPRDLTGGVPRTYLISPLDEAPRPGTEDVLYCAGHVTLRDGRILFMGGARYLNLGDKPGELEYGLNYFRLFDPRTLSFSRQEFAPQGSPRKQPGMDWYEDGMMWYPTETRLPGGKVLVAGGFDRNCSDGTCLNRDLEIFDADALLFDQNPWKTLVSHDAAPDVYDPGIKDYTHTFLLPRPAPAALGAGRERPLALIGWSGKIAFASLDESVSMRERVYVPQGSPSEPDSGRPGGAAAWDSSAALTGTGEILILGGGPNARQEAQRLDLYNPLTGKWRSRDTGITRHNPSTTLLPDGTVLILNGEPGDDLAVLGDRRQPQIYDPYTDKLSTLAAWPDANPAERGYHSFAILLKDGRIMTGGGMVGLGQVGCERPDVRIFNPPYLFKGPRPVAGGLAEHQEIALNSTFEIQVSGAPVRTDRGVVLMALGSETHSFDQNQRYVPLAFESRAPGRLSVKAPANGMIAPEGDYILYVISSDGVPSVGTHLRVQ